MLPVARKVAIVGGGITGLAAAYYLEQNTDCEIDLFECAASLGGKVGTSLEGEFVVEHGPDCFFARKKEALELAEELGLADQIIEPNVRHFQVLVGGKLYDVPPQLAGATQVDCTSLEQAAFLSEQGRKRAMEEPHQPQGNGEDESIASFFRRRFGSEFAQKIAEPVMAGTHSGSARDLSMQALYPSYLALEQKWGSLTAVPKGEPQGSPFLSLKHGMGALTQALRSRLTKTRVHGGVIVHKVVQGELFAGDQRVTFDHVLLTTSSHLAAGLLGNELPDLNSELKSIPHVSCPIVTLGYDRTHIARLLEGSGFLVPEAEIAEISGCTYSSEKWPYRAPANKVLLRVFLRRKPEWENAPVPDVEYRKLAIGALRSLLGITAAPIWSGIRAWRSAMPQYLVGHTAKVANIRELSPPWLTLAGASYRGVGISDCVRQAREAALEIAGG